jgi:hypothetical protein
MNLDIYFSYEDFNATYQHLPEIMVKPWTEDTHCEQLAFIVVLRKWRWEGNEGEPDLPFPGVSLWREEKLHDKADAFIYQRN